jgi:hypothetical protein
MFTSAQRGRGGVSPRSPRPIRRGAAGTALLVLALARTVPAVCVGDCNGDGRVSVEEIVRGVGIVLGTTPIGSCERLDRDGNGTVTIDELVAAVGFALRGCPATPVAASASPTPVMSPTATRVVPSASPTPSSTPVAVTACAADSDFCALTTAHGTCGPCLCSGVVAGCSGEPSSVACAAEVACITAGQCPCPMTIGCAAAVASNCATACCPAPCASIDPPQSFGAGFVDLTAGVESELPPIPSPDPGAPSNNSFAFISDLDADGVMEVVVTHEGPADRPALLRYDRPTRTLVRDVTAALPRASVLAVVDLDGDGMPDLFGDCNAPCVAWGRGGAAFDDPVPIVDDAPPTVARNYHAPYFDDVDGDGWLDVLLDSGVPCAEGGRSVRVLLAEGGRRWRPHTDLLPTELRIGDGVLFTAPLAGMDQTAVVLGEDCGAGAAPRLFAAARDADGFPRWTPSEPLVVYPRPDDPDPFSAPMGAAFGDVDGDGRLDLAISENPVLAMWHGVDAAPLPDVTNLTNMAIALGERGVPLIPWAVLFLDLDRDGRLDTFVTHGNDYSAEQRGDIGPQWSTAYWNGGGLCAYEISDRLNITRRGQWRALAVGDLEGDGLPDLAVGGLGEQPRILHNCIENGNRGFGLRLHGTTSNRYGIGARVDVAVSPGSPIQHRIVGGFYPPKIWVEPLVFVGLGAASAAGRVRITWPSGTVQELQDVAAGALYTVEEPPSIQIEPTTRHLLAGSQEVAIVRVTPRDPTGAIRGDAHVTVRIAAGDARLAAPATWNGSEWQAQVLPGAAGGSAVIEVEVDGTLLGVRPRIWFD